MLQPPGESTDGARRLFPFPACGDLHKVRVTRRDRLMRAKEFTGGAIDTPGKRFLEVFVPGDTVLTGLCRPQRPGAA